MSVFSKEEFPVKWVRAKHLKIVWAQAQRGLDQNKVERIKKNFDPDAVGVIVTTLPNGKGEYHVIDGQHRVEAVRQLWGGNEYMPCQVLDKESPKEAAEIFLKVNMDRKRPSPVSRFHVAVTAGREDAVAVDNLLDEMGYRVGMGGEDGMISAITACLSVYDKLGIEGLRDVLLLLRGSWGMERDAYHNSLIRGYARFLANYGDQADKERLVDKVSKKYTPASLLGAARTAREMFRGTIKENVTRILVTSYNHNLRSDRRLEEPSA